LSESDLYFGLFGQSQKNTLDEAISKFKSSIEPSDRQVTTVSERQEGVRKRILSNSNFDIERIVLHGSYARDTQIKPLPDTALLFYHEKEFVDVDSLLILENTQKNLEKYWYVNDGGTKALNDLRMSLEGYQGTSVKVDRPAVSVNWVGMKKEISPAFNAKGGGFLIPSRTHGGNWIHTDPLKDAEVLTNANKARKGEIKPLTKMMKSWNRNIGDVLESFAVETSVYHSTNDFSNIPDGIHNFFENIVQWNGKSLNTPSGIGQPIPIRIEDYQIETIKRNMAIFTLARQSFYRGDYQSAVRYFGMVFGKPFPGA